MEPIVHVENLSKRYRIGVREEQAANWRQGLFNVVKSPFKYLETSLRPATEQETLWAIRDISFDVKQGEILGIIGQNGAGKSTLLKILSRLTDPTDGRAVLRGRVGSLLEVGTGFHPELTGRENIYMSGTILGMKKREIDRKLDEIVEFANLDKFLDTPVKRYSSGMNVRLGFAVAAHLEPEILIVDEVLAVGDQTFQRKSLGKMENVSRHGRTILFVSHNMATIGSLCSRIIWLKDGKVVADGEPLAIIRQYVDEYAERMTGDKTVMDDFAHGFYLVRPEREYNFLCGEPIRFSYDVICPEPFKNPGSGIVFDDMTQRPIVGTSSIRQRMFATGVAKRWHIECDLGILPLNAGRYQISVWFGDEKSEKIRFSRQLFINIIPTDVFGFGKENPARWGYFYWKSDWAFSESDG